MPASLYPQFDFTILTQDPKSEARLGRITTPHGSVETPVFIFCATKAAIKAVPPWELDPLDTQIILSNTYHLMLQPGADIVARFGGLHRFMRWEGPMLTDSGGFQVFSLGHGSVADEIKGRRSDQARPPSLVKISEEGAAFRSYIDGSRHILTPESSIAIQRKLGADLIVVLDECTPYHADRNYTARSLALTHRWAKRSLAEFERGNDGRQALYGISQGGIHADLRHEAADFLNEQPFFGHAIGGTLGGSKAEMQSVVAYALADLRRDRPIHLLGIGGISDILNGVAKGIDSFDCVAPTRMARHGGALVQKAPKERINLRNARYAADEGPLDPLCHCPVCEGSFSRAYIHHLIRAGEILAMQLLSMHNIATMNRLLKEIRAAIPAGNLTSVAEKWLPEPAR